MSIEFFAALLILLPLGGAAVTGFATAVGGRYGIIGSEWITSVIAITLLAIDVVVLLAVRQSGTPVVISMGNWAAPFGIVLVADLLSLTMVLLSSIVFAASFLFSLETVDNATKAKFFYPLFLALVAGVHGSFLTGDVFNLYVMVEIMALSSAALMVLRASPQQVREGWLYLLLNIGLAAVLLVALRVTYTSFGTLNMADLAQKIAQHPDEPIVGLLVALYMIPFGIKAALFLGYFWLPGPYAAAVPAVTGYFSGLLTKVGVYVIFRLATLIFPSQQNLFPILLALAVLSMLVVFLAYSETNMRRILGYHITSQIGYMILGIGIATDQAYTAVVFYIFHHVAVKGGLFLIAGAVEFVAGSSDLAKVSGLKARYEALGTLFLVLGLSLAGVMPFSSGMVAKWSILRASMPHVQYVAVGLFVGLATLLSMRKIWNAIFWGKEKMVETLYLPLPRSAFAGIAILAILSLALGMPGLGATNLLWTIAKEATAMMQPEVYIPAVLGGT